MDRRKTLHITYYPVLAIGYAFVDLGYLQMCR